MLLAYRNCLYAHLQETCHPHSPLLRLWEKSYVDGACLVLSAEAATEIAEADPEGYHSGVWRISTEYEAFLAQALLANSNAHAPGHRQPKCFSAWPRRHCVDLYRQASTFRTTCLCFRDVTQTSPADRAAYLNLILQWHQSISYVSKISGHSRLDQSQLEQLCSALSLSQ